MAKNIIFFKKSIKNTIIPVLAAGIFFFMSISFLCGAQTSFAAKTKIRKGVYIDGIAVGGKSLQSARNIVCRAIEKELKEKSLVISTSRGKYIFGYPEINYTSDLEDILIKASAPVKGFAHDKIFFTKKRHHLNGLDEVVQMIALNAKKTEQDAVISFLPDEAQMFIFSPEKDGEGIDTKHLKEEIEKSLNSDFYQITAKTYKIKANITQNELKKYTFLKSRFSTGYTNSSEERKHNIALGASFINGFILKKGEEFSFNKTVGVRTAERGFKEAKIIMDGKYIEGIGGGVCQLSTTLYNAVITAGLKITEQHPHSMAVAYIEPSFDAMVNSYTSDLKFINDTEGDIYIKVKADGSKLSVAIYGESSIFEYRRKSIVTEEILPPPPEIIEGDKEEIVQYAKNGLKSCGFIEIYQNGKFIKRTQIRKDSYKPTREIKKILPELN